MDRYILFKNLRYLFGKVDPRYKVISYNGVELDLLDLLASPLYLAAIQAQYNEIDEVIPFRTLPVRKKINQLPKRLRTRLTYLIKNIERNKLLRLTPLKHTKANIVFWPVEPTHLNQQIPVAKILTEKGVQFNFITNQIKIYKNIRQAGFNAQFIDIKSDLIPLIHFEITELYDQISKNNLKDSKPIVDKKVIDFVILRLGFLMNEVLAIIRSILKYMVSMRPRVVLVGNDITLEGRVATKICQAMGINTACIMHGSIAGEPLHSMHIVDNYFVYGQIAKDYLVSIGINPENLFVCGAPYIERLSMVKKSVHPILRKKLRLKNQDGFVLLALSGPGHCTSYEHFNRIVESVVKFSAHEPDIDVVIKLHRKDSKKNYSRIMYHYPESNLLIVENGRKGFPTDIFDWLRGCKLVITGSSTVAIEAMLMKVPVITVDYMNEYQEVDFIDLEATFHVKTETELFEAIQDMFYLPENYKDTMRKAHHYIESYFYKPDGKASKRVADYLAHIGMKPT